MWLLHGTTMMRALRIIQMGPDLNFVEPGSFVGPDGMGAAENFSFTVESIPSSLGDSEEYARQKSNAFPQEQGPAIVAVDVPDEIVSEAAIEYLEGFRGIIEFEETDDLERLIILCGGVIQFDSGQALDRLIAGWDLFAKEIRGVT